MTRRRRVAVWAALVLLAGCTIGLIQCCPARPKPPSPDQTEPAQPAPTSQPSAVMSPQPATAPATQPAGPVAKGQLLDQTEARTKAAYQLYLPAGYRADRPWPTVVLLHGRGGAVAGGQLTDWLVAADRHGWLFAAPALKSPAAARRDALDDWSQPDEAVRTDLATVNAVLSELLDRWSVDRDRRSLVAYDWSTKLAAALVVERTGRFSRAVLISPRAPLNDVGRPAPGKAKGLLATAIWSDDDMGAASSGLQAVGFLQKSGASAGFNSFPRRDKLIEAAVEFLIWKDATARPPSSTTRPAGI